MKMEDYVLLDDEGNMTAKDGDLVEYIRCLACDKYVLARPIYKNQNVICPFCKTKLKIRFYKNNMVKIHLRDYK